MADLLSPVAILKKAHSQLCAYLSDVESIYCGDFELSNEKTGYFCNVSSAGVLQPVVIDTMISESVPCDGVDLTDAELSTPLLEFSRRNLDPAVLRMATRLLRLMSRDRPRLVTVPLELSGGLDWSERLVGNGITLRLERGKSLDTGRRRTILSVLCGFALPENASEVAILTARWQVTAVRERLAEESAKWAQAQVGDLEEERLKAHLAYLEAHRALRDHIADRGCRLVAIPS